MKEIIANSLKGSIKPPLDSVLESVILQRSYFPLLPTVISQEENDPNEKAIIQNISRLQLRRNRSLWYKFFSHFKLPLIKLHY